MLTSFFLTGDKKKKRNKSNKRFAKSKKIGVDKEYVGSLNFASSSLSSTHLLSQLRLNSESSFNFNNITANNHNTNNNTNNTTTNKFNQKTY